MIKYILPLILLFAFGCKKAPVFEQSKAIGNSGWHKDSIVEFTYSAVANIKAYDIFLDIENSDDYKWSNLFIFSDIYFPQNSEHIRDTLEFILADYKGEWTGEGTISFKSKFPFRKNVKFPQTGEYRFTIQQAMRCSDSENKIKGIENLSFSIYEKK